MNGIWDAWRLIVLLILVRLIVPCIKLCVHVRLSIIFVNKNYLFYLVSAVLWGSVKIDKIGKLGSSV